MDLGNAAYIGSILSLHDTFAGNVRSSCPKAVLLALDVEQCRLSDAMQAPCHELGSLIFQNPACLLMVIVEVVLQLVSHHLSQLFSSQSTSTPLVPLSVHTKPMPTVFDYVTKR